MNLALIRDLSTDLVQVLHVYQIISLAFCLLITLQGALLSVLYQKELCLATSSSMASSSDIYIITPTECSSLEFARLHLFICLEICLELCCFLNLDKDGLVEKLFDSYDRYITRTSVMMLWLLCWYLCYTGLGIDLAMKLTG